MKKTVAFILLIIAVSATIQAQKDFKLLDATVVSWAGGMQQSGHGTIYSLQLVLRTKEKIWFEDLWVGKDHINRQDVFFDHMKTRNPGKGDTITMTFAVTYKPHNSPSDETPESEDKLPPCEYKGRGLVAYTADGKRHYRAINNFRQLPARNYP